MEEKNDKLEKQKQKELQKELISTKKFFTLLFTKYIDICLSDTFLFTYDKESNPDFISVLYITDKFSITNILLRKNSFMNNSFILWLCSGESCVVEMASADFKYIKGAKTKDFLTLDKTDKIFTLSLDNPKKSFIYTKESLKFKNNIYHNINELDLSQGEKIKQVKLKNKILNENILNLYLTENNKIVYKEIGKRILEINTSLLNIKQKDKPIKSKSPERSSDIYVSAVKFSKYYLVYLMSDSTDVIVRQVFKTI